MSVNLAQKMINIMGRVESVYKGARVSITQTSSYAAVSHDDVAALLHNELVGEGVWVKVSVIEASVSVQQKTKPGHNGAAATVSNEYMASIKCRVTFINAEDPKDREEVDTFAYALDSGDKAVGKAESMAVKYAFLKNFTLESTDQEEEREGAKYETIPKQTPAKEAQQSNESTVSDAQKKVLHAIKSKYAVTIPEFRTSNEASIWINNFNKSKKS